MKICSKCKIEKLKTEFNKNQNRNDGLQSACKLCRKHYRIENRDKILKKKKQLYYSKKQEILAKSKEWRNSKLAEISNKKQCYYNLNKKYILTKNKEYRKTKIGKEKLAEYLEKNKEKIKTRRKAYNKFNKEKIKAYKNQQYKNNIQYKLRDVLKRGLNRSLKNKNLKKAASITELIGCSLEQLKQYLESKFQPGMSWDNHSRFGWHIDHIKPLVSFDLSNLNKVKEACHYTNLQPLWWLDNLKKSDKLWE